MIQFHETRLGRMFYERDVPALVRQLTRLNEILERALVRREGESEEPFNSAVDPDPSGRPKSD